MRETLVHRRSSFAGHSGHTNNSSTIPIGRSDHHVGSTSTRFFLGIHTCTEDSKETMDITRAGVVTLRNKANITYSRREEESLDPQGLAGEPNHRFYTRGCAGLLGHEQKQGIVQPYMIIINTELPRPL